MSEAAVVMAAGKGTRMKSDLPKVLHLAAGRPLVSWVIKACREAGIERIVVIVGYQEKLVRAAVACERVTCVTQAEQLGTGHAAAQAHDALADFEGRLFVLNGDAPLITGETLAALREQHVAQRADATLLTITPERPLAYGRVIHGPDGLVVDVVEERDCTDEQKALRELNAGFYVFNAPAVWDGLASLGNRNRAGEYYVTDMARYYGRGGGRVVAVEADETVAMGVNTPEQLAAVEDMLQRRLSGDS